MISLGERRKNALLCWLPVFLLPVSNILTAIYYKHLPVWALAAPVAAVCEELFFRGLLLKVWLLPRMRPILAVLLSAGSFGVMHLLNLTNGTSYGLVFIQVLFALCFGIWAGAVVCRTGWIAIPLSAHVLLNLTDASAGVSGSFALAVCITSAGLVLLDGILLLAER